MTSTLLQLQPKPTRITTPIHEVRTTRRHILRGLKDAIVQKHPSVQSVRCIYRGLGRFEVIGKPGMRAHLENPKQCSRSFKFGEVYCMDIVDVRTADHGRGLVRFDLLLDPEGPQARIRKAALARG